MRRVVRDAVHAYALAFLEEEGGTPVDAIRKADQEFTVALAKCRSSMWVDEAMEDDLLNEVARIQAGVTARICTGEKLWISSGPGCRWHRVATPTRAHCGMAINHGDKAWAVRTEPPDDPVEWGHPDYDSGNAGKCVGCDKR
jgi:hypothetical protein